MKKIFIIAMLAMTASMANAQLRVDSLGHIGIGTNQNLISLLNVGGTQNTSSGQAYKVFIKPSATGGLYIKNDTTAYANSSNLCGVCTSINNVKNTTRTWGHYANVKGRNRVYGSIGMAEGGTQNIGTCGKIYGTGIQNTAFGAGILGTTGLYDVPNVTGVYAGYFRGDIRVTGSIYGTVLSPTATSSPSGSETTSVLGVADRGNTVVDKLQQVDILQMERVNQDGSYAANKILENENVRGDSPDDEDGESEMRNDEPIQTKLSSISYGLAADQLREVYPELVYDDGQGNYSINYVEMVPLLVQSIKELSAKVTILEEQLGIQETTKPVMKTKGKTEDADNVTLTFPDNAHEATLNIYDLSGKLLRTSPVNMAETRNLSNYTRGLPTGTYAYTLTVNGRKQKARKVVVKN